MGCVLGCCSKRKENVPSVCTQSVANNFPVCFNIPTTSFISLKQDDGSNSDLPANDCGKETEDSTVRNPLYVSCKWSYPMNTLGWA